MEERDEAVDEGNDEYAPPVVVDYGLLARHANVTANGVGADNGQYES